MDKIIGAIANSVIVQTHAPAAVDRELARQTGGILYRRISKMPCGPKALILVSTMIFEASGFFYAAKPFSRQSLQQQQRMLNSVGLCGWKAAGQFLKFYQKFSLFIYYSLREELK